MTDLNGGHLVARTLKQAGVRHALVAKGMDRKCIKWEKFW